MAFAVQQPGPTTHASRLGARALITINGRRLAGATTPTRASWTMGDDLAWRNAAHRDTRQQWWVRLNGWLVVVVVASSHGDR